MNFKLHSQFKPTGDQPQAIEKLTPRFLCRCNYEVQAFPANPAEQFDWKEEETCSEDKRLRA